MRLLILGGKLQGMEAVYLAKRAGWKTMVADRNPDVPAAGLSDEFVQTDLLDKERTLELFRAADAVLPAMENAEVLGHVEEWGRKTGVRTLFDWKAYQISSSKKRSNELFSDLGLPMPESWPSCGYPVIVKPDDRSGSEGVRVIRNGTEMEKFIGDSGRAGVVIQQYLPGRSWSLEVIGDGEHFFFPEVTEVITDSCFDCSRITAHERDDPRVREQMTAIGRKLARALKIRGIFDIEVIDDNGVLKILEIDARLPSQTPVSVFHSTGINMLEMMLHPELQPRENSRRRCCLYQQIQVRGGCIRLIGERVMADRHPMRDLKNFFGADEAITDYTEGSCDFCAILLITRDTEEEALAVYENMIRNLQNRPETKNWKYVNH